MALGKPRVIGGMTQRSVLTTGAGGIVQDSNVADDASCFASNILDGQVALVTGGATGIGKEICRVLGAHGARITMASRKQEILEDATDELRAEGIDVSFGVCDVRDADAVRAVIDGVVADRGGSTSWSTMRPAISPRRCRRSRRTDSRQWSTSTCWGRTT
jgi:NADPH:quinone reductase-like Zn-dependent oxidoreductase